MSKSKSTDKASLIFYIHYIILMSSEPNFIPNNNWTDIILNYLGNDVTASPNLLFEINKDGITSDNPVNKCASPLFSASYTCGNDTVQKTISLSDAWGKTSEFVCKDNFTKCSNVLLTLDDKGILTLTDAEGNTLWKTAAPATNDNNPPLTLPQYAAKSTNPAPNRHSQNSFLKSNEFLSVGEWIGSPSGTFRLELVEVVDPHADKGVWVNVGTFTDGWGSFTITVDRTVLRTSKTDLIGSFFSKGSTSTNHQWQMLATTDSSKTKDPIPLISPPPPKMLQVVYNVLGCSTESSLNNQSTQLYSIPSINVQNVGSAGYVNEFGQLQQYPENMTTYKNADYQMVGKYGVVGGDLDSSTTVNDAEECKTKCSNYVGLGEQCAGFVYEKVGRTCQLKSPSVLNTGNRFINDNYEYYVRTLQVSPDVSCPQSIEPHDTTKWDTLSANMGAGMEADTPCGLKKFTQAERDAKQDAFNALDIDASDNIVSTQINYLYKKYNTLKDWLFNTQKSLDSSFNELQKTKKEKEDWSGEQTQQLKAMNEESDLNMMSQNYMYIFWRILAIIVVIGIITFISSMGSSKGTSTDITTPAAGTPGSSIGDALSPAAAAK